MTLLCLKIKLPSDKHVLKRKHANHFAAFGRKKNVEFNNNNDSVENNFTFAFVNLEEFHEMIYNRKMNSAKTNFKIAVHQTIL